MQPGRDRTPKAASRPDRRHEDQSANSSVAPLVTTLAVRPGTPDGCRPAALPKSSESGHLAAEIGLADWCNSAKAPKKLLQCPAEASTAMIAATMSPASCCLFRRRRTPRTASPGYRTRRCACRSVLSACLSVCGGTRVEDRQDLSGYTFLLLMPLPAAR